MKEKKVTVSYKELMNADELPVHLAELIVNAKIAIAAAYAPYSNFKVGAAALLENGKIIMGSNQENASLPAGICAERVALSAASSAHPLVPVIALAVSAKGGRQKITDPVAPCGICRQTLLEYEARFHHNIEIILQGEQGKIYWISSVKDLLPFNFSGENLK
ncbi:MAG: cytidine deaminase [Chitinophagales bacterium]